MKAWNKIYFWQGGTKMSKSLIFWSSEVYFLDVSHIQFRDLSKEELEIPLLNYGRKNEELFSWTIISFKIHKISVSPALNKPGNWELDASGMKGSV